MSEIKKCTKCGESKPATTEYFYAKSGSNGLRYMCKTCQSIQSKKYSSDNKERLSEYNRQHYQKNKEYYREKHRLYSKNNRDKIAEYHKTIHDKLVAYNKVYGIEYRILNMDRIKAKNKLYRSNNKNIIRMRNSVYFQKEEVITRHKKWQKEWRKNNKDKVRVSKVKRRTIEKGLVSTLTSGEWAECKQYFENKCAYCGNELHLTVDHFIPLSKGGELSKSNTVPACLGCNCSKRASDFFSWYPTFKHYSKKREQKILKYLGYYNRVQQLSLA